MTSKKRILEESRLREKISKFDKKFNQDELQLLFSDAAFFDKLSTKKRYLMYFYIFMAFFSVFAFQWSWVVGIGLISIFFWLYLQTKGVAYDCECVSKKMYEKGWTFSDYLTHTERGLEMR
jgi:hypothetical protein